jgi:hypothetical protein
MLFLHPIFKKKRFYLVYTILKTEILVSNVFFPLIFGLCGLVIYDVRHLQDNIEYLDQQKYV